MIKKADWLAIAKDRTTILLLFGLLVGLIAILITTALRLHPSDVQIPMRYSGYGSANIYRDQWYMIFALPGFAALVVFLNAYLAIKIYHLSRMMCLGILTFTLFINLLCFIVTNAIFNLAPAV